MLFPVLHGNWVDFIIIAFIFFYIWEGWGKGFLAITLDLIAFTSSFLIALKFYGALGHFLVVNFSFTQGLANALGFILLWVVSEQIFIHLLELIEQKIPNTWQTHPLNKALAILPLIANAIIIVAVLTTLMVGLPIAPQVKAAVSDSKIAGILTQQTSVIEKTLAGIFGEAVSDTFNFITINPTSHEQIKLNFSQREMSIDEGSEAQMVDRVNKERRDRGLTELVINAKLRDLARAYAKDMLERGYFSHYNPEGESPFDRMANAGITYRAAGENLALAPNVTIAHQGLMDSPGHRANILSPDYRKVGIGVVDGGIYGKMFVQEFTD